MENLFDTYRSGGVQFMHPLTLLFIFNVVMIGMILYRTAAKINVPSKWIESIKHVSGFAVAFGTFGSLTGLLQAFDALEKSIQVIPFQVIMGGMKVALINIIYGLLIFCISMLGYVLLKLRMRDVSVNV